MDKKKRSSLKRSSLLTENREGVVADVAFRQKRRISFSGKKLVREFSADDQAKAWNNSYEISDPQNISDEKATTKGAVSIQMSVAGRENIVLDSNKSFSALRLRNADNKLCNNNMGVNVTLFEKEISIASKISLLQYNKENNETQKQNIDIVESFSTTLSKSKRRDHEKTNFYSEHMQESTFNEDSPVVQSSTVYTNENMLLDNDGTNKSIFSMLQTSEMDLSFDCTSNARAEIENVNNTKYDTCMDIENTNDANNINMSLDLEDITNKFSEKLEGISLHADEKDPIFLKNMERPNVFPSTNIAVKVKKTSPSNIMGTPNKYNSAKVNVRKTCIPFKIVPDEVIEQRSPKLLNSLSIDESRDEYIFNLSNNSFLSESVPSPLFPTEFLLSKNKKLNFRQLNDDIGHGKIVVFPKSDESFGNKATDEIQKQAIVNEISSQKWLYDNSEPINMSVEEIGEDIKNSNIDSNKTGLSLQRSCKSDTGFYNTEEMLLEHTSYLVQANLEDESSTRLKTIPDDLEFSGKVSNDENMNNKTDIGIREEVDEIPCSNDSYMQSKIVNKQRGQTALVLSSATLSDSKNSTPKLNENSNQSSLHLRLTQPLESNTEKQNEATYTQPKKCETNEHFATEDKTSNISAELATEHENQDQNVPVFPQTSKDSIQNDFNDKLEISPANRVQTARRTIIFSTKNNIPLDDSLNVSDVINEVNKIENLGKENNSNENIQRKLEADKYAVQHLVATKILNHTKTNLSRQSALHTDDTNDSLMLQLKQARAITFNNCERKTMYFDQNAEMSPDGSPVVRNEQKTKLLRHYDGTPHRSVIEFECLEIEAEKEQERSEEERKIRAEIISNNEEKAKTKLRRQTAYETHELDVSGLKLLQNDNFDDSMAMSPVVNISNKRATYNLTPNFPISKKRQTIMFSNCNIEETAVVPTNILNENKHATNCEDSAILPVSNEKHENFCNAASNSNDFITKGNIENSSKMELSFEMTHESFKCCDTHGNIGQLACEQRENSPNNRHTDCSPMLLESMKEQNNDLSHCISPKKIIDTELNCFVDTISIARRAPQTDRTTVHKHCPPMLLESIKKQSNGLSHCISPKESNDTELNCFVDTITVARRATKNIRDRNSAHKDCPPMLLESMKKQSNDLSHCLSPKKSNDTELNSFVDTISVTRATTHQVDKNTVHKDCPPMLREILKQQSNDLSRYVSPKKSNESELNSFADTISVPRRATTFQADRSIHFISENNAEKEPEKEPSIVPAFEENPITISDVSAHYLALRNTFAIQQGNTPQQEDSLVDLCTNNTINRLANFKKDFINLTRVNSFGNDDIDKTRLSLVESLLSENDESKEENESEKESEDDFEKEKLEEEDSEKLSSTQQLHDNNRKRVSLCYRCKRCQETFNLDGTSNTIDSFVLPLVLKFPDLGLEELERLRKQPTIEDVEEYWRRRSLEKTFSIGNTSSNSEQPSCESIEVNRPKSGPFIAVLQEIERIEREISDIRNLNLSEKTNLFVKRLDALISKSSPNWIFDFQMQMAGRFQFYHKQVITSIIEVTFEYTDALKNSVEIKSIKKQYSRVPKKNWMPIDYILDFQLEVELSFLLRCTRIINTENGLLEVLKSVDQVYQRISKMAIKLWKLVIRENGSLLRENSQTIIQKVIRDVNERDSTVNVEKQLFRIEIKNLNDLCFNDIVYPPLYTFRDEIQYLPIGLDFLHIFLKHPTKFLKNDACNSAG